MPDDPGMPPGDDPVRSGERNERSSLTHEPGQRSSLEREIGRYDTGRPGPLFIAVGGMHGNEPGGVLAAEGLFDELERHRVELQGRLVALRGNCAALALETRFVEEDFNRVWTPEKLGKLERQTPNADGSEEAELRGLRETLEALFVEPIAGRPPAGVVLLDLHSTSGPSKPFLCMADTLQNRRVAFGLGVPVILGLEEALPGTLLDWMSEAGHVAIAFEGGTHASKDIERCHRAAILCALEAAGMVAEGVMDIARERKRLQSMAEGLPEIVEILTRHATVPGDGFTMDPGWQSFESVKRGERLAEDHSGVLLAAHDGRMLLPRYQPQGNDGFFVARDVRPFWLWISALLRRLGAERALPLLPGVRRDPSDPRALRVDPARARYLVTQVFHLFGYRRAAQDGEQLVFIRRPDDPAELRKGGLGLSRG